MTRQFAESLWSRSHTNLSMLHHSQRSAGRAREDVWSLSWKALSHPSPCCFEMFASMRQICDVEVPWHGQLADITLTDICHAAAGSQPAGSALASVSCRLQVISIFQKLITFYSSSFLPFNLWPIDLALISIDWWTLEKDCFCTVKWTGFFARKAYGTVPCGWKKGMIPGRCFDIRSWVYWICLCPRVFTFPSQHQVVDVFTDETSDPC